MENKKGFKRQLTIEEMRAKKAALESAEHVPIEADLFAHYIDGETDKVVASVLAEMGFPAKEGMTQEELEDLVSDMSNSGVEVQIETETADSKFFVKVKVIQIARVLEFDLNGVDPPEKDTL